MNQTKQTTRAHFLIVLVQWAPLGMLASTATLHVLFASVAPKTSGTVLNIRGWNRDIPLSAAEKLLDTGHLFNNIGRVGRQFSGHFEDSRNATKLKLGSPSRLPCKCDQQAHQHMEKLNSSTLGMHCGHVITL